MLLRARQVHADLEQRLGYLAIALEPLVAALGRSRRDHARWLLLVLLRGAPLARWWLLGVAAVADGSLATLALLAVFVGQLLVF